MKAEYIINHATKSVTIAGTNHGKMRLLDFKTDEYGIVFFAVHEKGSKSYSGLGRPQRYNPAEIKVCRGTHKQMLNNDSEVIYVNSPLLSWDVTAQSKDENR